MRRFLYDVITHQRDDRLARTVRRGLRPFSGLYRFYLLLDTWRRICSSPRYLDCPVISVGNIIAGGTGKTVIVRAIAEQYLTWGYHPLILTRGYGGRAGDSYQVASDGSGRLASPDIVGDEAVMLGKQLADVPVIVGRDRIWAAEQAYQAFRPDLVILDDAFQYRRLARDLDIVAIPAPRPWGTGELLPAGTLREPRSALSRAGMILLTHVDQVADRDRVCTDILRGLAGLPLAETRHRAVGLRQISTGASEPLSELQGRRVLAASAIGSPDAFARTLENFGAEVIPMSFPDHHRYSGKDIERIREFQAANRADWVVVTEKDVVKLEPSLDWYCLEVRLEIVAGRDVWEMMLRRIVLS